MATQTSTDPRRFAWAIRDKVIRLRAWGTDDFYDLPPARGRSLRDWKIGSSSRCAIHLDDPWISREHALLSDEGERWSLSDLSSKNGVRIDGVQMQTARLEPGMEIIIGRTTLLAESMGSIGLRCFLGRLMGWDASRRRAVDAALREIRTAQIRKCPIVLQGEGDLVPIAEDLHHFVFGARAPFVVCDPYRRTGEASARVPANIEDGEDALAAAQGGTLCIRNDKPPSSFEEILAKACAAEGPTTVQVVMCDDGSRKLRVAGAKPIVIPRLSSRKAAERAHVVTEYVGEAAQNLGADRPLSAKDQAWVLKCNATSLAEIRKGVRRLLALRLEGSLAGAARRLGMTQPALRRWFADRAPLPGLRPEDVEAIAAESTELDA